MNAYRKPAQSKTCAPRPAAQSIYVHPILSQRELHAFEMKLESPLPGMKNMRGKGPVKAYLEN